MSEPGHAAPDSTAAKTGRLQRAQDSQTQDPLEEPPSNGLLADPRLSQMSPAQRARFVQRMQRHAGNAYVARTIAQVHRPPAAPASPSPAPISPASAPVVVQRDSDDGADSGLLATVRAKLSAVTDRLKSGWTGLTQMAEGAFDSLEQRASGLKDTLTGMVSNALDGIQAGWNNLKQVGASITQAIEGRLQAGLHSLVGMGRELATAIAHIDPSGFQAIWSRLSGGVDTLRQGVDAVGKSAMARLTGLWDGLGQRFDGALSSIGGTAQSLLGGLSSVADGVRSRISGVWAGLQQTAGTMSGLVDKLPGPLRSLAERVLQGARGAWDNMQGLWGGLQQRLSSVWERVKAGATSAWEGLKTRAQSTWSTITSAWGQVRDTAAAQVQKFVGAPLDLWRKISGLNVGSVIDALMKWSPLVKWIVEAIRNPMGVMQPIAVSMTTKLEAEFPGAAPGLLQEKLGEASGGSTPQPTAAAGGAVQRQAAPSPAPAPAAPVTAVRATASFGDLFEGVWEVLKDKWAKTKILDVVLSFLISAVYPFPVIADEWHAMTAELSGDVDRLSAGSGLSGFMAFWAGLLRVLDMIFSIWRHINNILIALMPLFTLIMVGLGALVGGLAGGLLGGGVAAFFTEGVGAPVGAAFGGATTASAGAAAGLTIALNVGRPLFMSFIIAEGASLVRAAGEALTVPQTAQERAKDYEQIANSAIGLVVAGILAALAAIASAAGRAFLRAAAENPSGLAGRIAAGARGLFDKLRGKGGGEPELPKGGEVDPAALAASRASMATRITALADELKATRASIDALPDTAPEKAGLQKRAGDAQGKLDASKASLDTQTSPDAIDKNVKPDVDAADADVKKLKGDVELLEKLLSARKTVKADIAKANDDLSRVRDHVNDLPDDPANLKTRLQLKRIGDKLAKLDADADAATSAEAIDKDVKPGVESATDDINDLKKQVRTQEIAGLENDPQTGKPNPKSVGEARTALAAEAKGVIQGPRRPNLARGDPNLDFKVDGPGAFKFAEVKTPPSPKVQPIAQSAADIAPQIDPLARQGNIKVLIDLGQLADAAEKNAFKAELTKNGANIADPAVAFIND